MKTITTDNGSKFAKHKLITDKLKVDVYFTDPYASWQKGSIENANKLIWPHLTKRTSLDDITEMYINRIQHKINDRPRKKLNFNPPKLVFYNLLNFLCT